MSEEIGHISLYLAKEGTSFDSIVKAQNVREEGEDFKIRNIQFDDCEIRFYYFQTKTPKSTPPWLEFVNTRISSNNERITFSTLSQRPNGLLLILIKGRIFAATFGMSGKTLLDTTQIISDFGIKTAMNMCGNKELRQTKTRTHTLTTQQIDRQLSKPSDSFEFGLGETEFLKYISAHLESNKCVTLQGKDSITIKVIGDEKLSWGSLISYCQTFLDEYQKDRYKTLFPNYPNLQNVDDERMRELDKNLVERLRRKDLSCFHLAIPEFIPDDEYSFSYTNYHGRPNRIVSYIDISDLKDSDVIDLSNIEIRKLKSKKVYAYSHTENKILDYHKWSLYSCIVAEIEIDGEYFILSEGEWRKVDEGFYKSVNDFIEFELEVRDIPAKYKDIDISDMEKNQNREEKFNQSYVKRNRNALLFDKAKLRIGQSSKDSEFCDILERGSNGCIGIIHVKRYGGSSSINHLFTQARFYCEFFLSDETFLKGIRDHIKSSDHLEKRKFLSYIKENVEDVSGNDYEVKLWILYNKSLENVPDKSTLPLMAKYELKLTYDRLRKVNKFRAVSLSMVPVKQVKFTTIKK